MDDIETARSTTHTGLMHNLAKRGVEVKMALLDNPFLPAEELARLASDKDPAVRAKAEDLRDNPRTPEQRSAATNAYARSIPLNLISTTDSIPGHTITSIVTVVSNVNASSGWTATSKGNTALNAALLDLGAQAKSMGANAIVGLTGSSFGARGGVTSVVGGDAVGVLLMGTAVMIEKNSGHPV